KLLIKKGKLETRFTIFRQYWKLMLRRVILSMIVLTYPAIAAVALWEMVMKDSPAAVVIAVEIFIVMTALLSYEMYKLYGLLRSKKVMPFSSSGPLAKYASKTGDREQAVAAPMTWRDPNNGMTELKMDASKSLKQFAILTLPYRRSSAYWVL